MSTRPKVVVVFPAAHGRGGVERVAWDLLHYLAGQDREVAFLGQELAPGADPRIEHLAVIPAARLPAPVAFRRAAAARLAALGPVRTISLGVNCPPGDVYLVGSVHRSFLRSAKTVPIAGRDVPAGVRYVMPRHQVLLGLERSYFRSSRPRAILCCSQREADDLASLYGTDQSLLHVVPNGFDPAVFHPRPTAVRAATRLAMGAADDDVVLLLMANELHRKGFGPLIEAVEKVTDPRLRVCVVGRADIGPYRGQLARLGLTDRVTWHGPTSDAASWYAGADALVLPTQYEPFGLVIVEALATGLPVITTRLAGAAAAVQPGITGLLQSDPFDVDELAGLLRQALDTDTRTRWAAAASVSVVPFRQDRVFSQVEDFLR